MINNKLLIINNENRIKKQDIKHTRNKAKQIKNDMGQQAEPPF